MVRTDFKDPDLNLADIDTINYKDTKFLNNFIATRVKFYLVA